jgi:hypothetical protein
MADIEPEAKPASQPVLPAALLAGGIALLVASFFWPGQSISRTAWSPEQAKAYQAASVKLHSLSQETAASAGRNNEKALREKLSKAEADYKAIRTQLDAAIDRPKHVTLFLRICGSLLAIIGLSMIYSRAGNQSADAR